MARRSWVGRRVKLLRDLQNSSDVAFKAGDEAVIHSVSRGVTLQTVDGRIVTRVRDDAFQLLPEIPEARRVAMYNASRILRCYAASCKSRGEMTGLGLGNLPAEFGDVEVGDVWRHIDRIAEVLQLESGLTINSPGGRLWSEMPMAPLPKE